MKGEVTKHTLAEEHLPHEMTLIVYRSHKNKFKLALERLNGFQQTPINVIPLQHSPELISRNPVICFLLINKTCAYILCILPGFLKNLPQSENLYVERALILFNYEEANDKINVKIGAARF